MFSNYKFTSLGISLFLFALMVFTARVGLAQSGSNIVPDRLFPTISDEVLNQYIAECQSMTSGSTQECTSYAFELTGGNNLASAEVQSVQYGLTVQTVSPYDEAMVDGFIAECQSMTEESIQACTNYAFELASLGSK